MNPIPNPNSNPPLIDSYFSYFSQNPNPQFPLQQLPHGYIDPSAAATTALAPPGVDAYPTLTTLPQAQASTLVQPGSTSYYLDQNFQNWVAKEAVRQYGSDPAGYGGAASATIPQDGTQQLAIALPGSAEWANWVAQLQANGTWKRREKKTKVVQSAYCEVCQVDCNSKEVLDRHKLGKKHKKNLEKLQEAAAGPANSSVPVNPFIGPQKEPDNVKTSNVQKGKKKVARPAEDLETKRRKIVQGGAAVEAIRICAICNVVCNSENVYNFHLSGRKHAIMLKKHGIRMVAAT
ncbi:hypothetical protein JCGZ_19918 [Jatropha curcas]|uniref:U1-type domain-containing protein n=1 Tax=Jatropha curcas TaxID=180498 RepID=A0A067K622_JATCU|nr:hypothetical protein JCGZ_19918 [Jatropha curcas]